METMQFNELYPHNSPKEVVCVPRSDKLGFGPMDNISEHPSYSTGRLKDLGEYRFRLNPTVNDHDFRDLKNKHLIPNPNEAGAKYFDRLSDSTWADFMEEQVDHGFDMIYIRIHGRTETADNQGSRILAHVVSNQELIYDDQSYLSRFMTPSKGVPDAMLKRVQGLMKHQIAAAHKVYQGGLA